MAAGHRVAERFSWQSSARRHLEVYGALQPSTALPAYAGLPPESDSAVGSG